MLYFKGLKVLFFKGTPSMPSVMYLPGKILVQKGSLAATVLRTIV